MINVCGMGEEVLSKGMLIKYSDDLMMRHLFYGNFSKQNSGRTFFGNALKWPVIYCAIITVAVASKSGTNDVVNRWWPNGKPKNLTSRPSDWNAFCLFSHFQSENVCHNWTMNSMWRKFFNRHLNIIWKYVCRFQCRPASTCKYYCTSAMCSTHIPIQIDWQYGIWIQR